MITLVSAVVSILLLVALVYVVVAGLMRMF